MASLFLRGEGAPTQILTDPFVAKLERAFGLQLYQAVKLRTVLGLRTSAGALVLKRYAGDGFKRRLDALADALDRVQEEGVAVAAYLRTQTGTPYVVDQGAFWTLQPWLSGRHVSLGHREERLAAVRALAKLHRVKTGQHLEKFVLRVPPLWEKYRYRLEKAQDASLFARDVRETWQVFAERARQSVRELQQEAFTRAIERDWQSGAFCHRDPAPHNFIWQGAHAKEPAALIDFDLAGFDVRAHDLYQLMNHALYLNGWEPGLFATMVEAYDQVYPLGSDNQKVLAALMQYPSLVVREWYDFGKNKQVKTLKTRLKWAMLQEEKRLGEKNSALL